MMRLGKFAVFLAILCSLGCPRPVPVGDNKFVYVVNMTEGEIVTVYLQEFLDNWPGLDRLTMPIPKTRWASWSADGMQTVNVAAIVDLFDERDTRVHEAFNLPIFKNETIVIWIQDPEYLGSPNDANYHPVNTYLEVDRWFTADWQFFIAILENSKSDVEAVAYLDSLRVMR